VTIMSKVGMIRIFFAMLKPPVANIYQYP